MQPHLLSSSQEPRLRGSPAERKVFFTQQPKVSHTASGTASAASVATARKNQTIYKGQVNMSESIAAHPEKPSVAIIGAGPAGLTAAYLLAKQGVKVTVMEADPKYVGGISK